AEAERADTGANGEGRGCTGATRPPHGERRRESRLLPAPRYGLWWGRNRLPYGRHPYSQGVDRRNARAHQRQPARATGRRRRRPSQPLAPPQLRGLTPASLTLFLALPKAGQTSLE